MVEIEREMVLRRRTPVGFPARVVSPFLSVTTGESLPPVGVCSTLRRNGSRLPMLDCPLNICLSLVPAKVGLAVTRFRTRARLAQPRILIGVSFVAPRREKLPAFKRVLLSFTIHFFSFSFSPLEARATIVELHRTLDVRSEEARLMDQFILSINDFGSRARPRSEELISHSRKLETETRLTIIFVNSNHSPAEWLLNILPLIMNGFCNQRQIQPYLSSGNPR